MPNLSNLDETWLAERQQRGECACLIEGQWFGEPSWPLLLGTPHTDADLAVEGTSLIQIGHDEKRCFKVYVRADVYGG